MYRTFQLQLAERVRELLRRQYDVELANIVIEQPRKAFRSVPCNQRLKEKEKLMLPFGQTLKGRQQHRDIVFLLPFHDGCWMLARRRQIRAVIGALNFCESLRAAAHRADRLMQSRTRAAWLTCVADWTGHLVSFEL